MTIPGGAMKSPGGVMKTSGMYSALSVSLFLHCFAIVVAVLIMKHSAMFMTPLPYVVSLVDNTSTSDAGGSKSPVVKEEKALPPEPDIRKQDKEKTVKDATRVSDQIAALQAKKKIEKLAALRTMVDIGGQKTAVPKSGAPVAGGQSGDAAGSNSYYSLIVQKIRQQWVFPETVDKELLAEITIRIARNGSVTIINVEKSSGNRLFDRSVLNAINRANPLPPPPQELEMGVRFYP